MNPLLRDLYNPQVWADAEHWRAIGAHPPARDDQTIRGRLHHIAIVQRAFLWAVGDRQDQFAFTNPDDFATLDDLKQYSRAHHDRISDYMATVSDARLGELVEIPWFNDPPLTLKIEEALMQGAMHSHLSSRPECDAAARARRRAADDRLDSLVLEGTSCAGMVIVDCSRAVLSRLRSQGFLASFGGARRRRQSRPLSALPHR